MTAETPSVLNHTETVYFISYENEYADLLEQAGEWVRAKSVEREPHGDVVVLSIGFYRDAEQDVAALTMTVETDVTLGITARETRELIRKWETTSEIMREAARQDYAKGNHDQGNHASGIADGLNVAIWSLKLLAGEYEGETIQARRLESVDG